MELQLLKEQEKRESDVLENPTLSYRKIHESGEKVATWLLNLGGLLYGFGIHIYDQFVVLTLEYKVSV